MEGANMFPKKIHIREQQLESFDEQSTPPLKTPKSRG
jgi:hypothetical protein